MAEQSRLPGAGTSDYTVPATTYISRLPVPAEAASAERESLALEQPHWPLIVMLLLTQIATGGYLALAIISVISPGLFRTVAPAAATVDWVVLQLGLGAAFFHLGRPMGTWRFFLGLGSSWMSREILAFGILSLAAACLPLIARCGLGTWVVAVSSQVVAVLSLVAVFTSVMVYADTRRPIWSFSRTITGFGGTVLQSVALSVVWMLDSPRLSAQDVPLIYGNLLLLGCFAGVLFWLRSADQQRAASNRFHPCHSSAELVKYRLRPLQLVSGCLLILLVGVLTFRLTAGAPNGIVMALLATSLLVRELIARYIFFATVTNSR
jgi:DMSO reductase anchor subunit